MDLQYVAFDALVHRWCIGGALVNKAKVKKYFATVIPESKMLIKSTPLVQKDAIAERCKTLGISVILRIGENVQTSTYASPLLWWCARALMRSSVYYH